MAEQIIPPRRNEDLTTSGRGTTRFMEYLERASRVTNETASAVDAQIIQNLSSVVYALQLQVGSGDMLTSDCDSLTVDSDILYCDMTEA